MGGGKDDVGVGEGGKMCRQRRHAHKGSTYESRVLQPAGVGQDGMDKGGQDVDEFQEGSCKD